MLLWSVQLVKERRGGRKGKEGERGKEGESKDVGGPEEQERLAH